MFPGIIAVDLSVAGEVKYSVVKANRLWLAKNVAVGGKIVTNPINTPGPGLAPVIGIRIQDRSNDQMPWSLQDGFMDSFSGEFDTLYIQVLSYFGFGGDHYYLNTGRDVAAGYVAVP